MSQNILMPKPGADIDHARLAKWLKPVGGAFHVGDILAEIETARATMEIEALADGVLAEILVAAGTLDVATGTVLARYTSMEQVSPLFEREPLARPERQNERLDVAAPLQQPEERSGGSQFLAGTPVLRMSVRDALRDAMAEEMRRDGDVFIIGEEVADYEGAHKVTQGLAQEFGEKRVVDTPITEQGFTGLAIGSAYAGMRPIVEFMTFNFALQAIDQIINSAAKIRYISGGQISCPVVFRGPNGMAPRVGAQHAQDFCAMFSHIPGLKVVAPYTAADAKGLLKAAIRDPDPVVFLENEILYGMTFDVPQDGDHVVQIGQAKIVRSGEHVTIVSFSIGMIHALKAAEMLAAEGVEAEVIDLLTLRPMDSAAILTSVMKTGRCVTVEEGWPQSGIGAEISARLMEDGFAHLKAPVQRVTGRDVPMPYSAKLEALALPNADDVVAAVRKTLTGFPLSR